MTQTDQNVSDQASLLALAVEGDAKAARVLTRELGRRAFAQAFRMLGNQAEAEDIVQDAMLRLWRVAPNWDAQTAQPSTWLYKVVTNLCIDRMRRTKPASLDAEGAPVPEDPTPSVDARMMARTRLQALHQALRSLPDRQQQAVTLRHIEGMANPDIADLMGISVDAVESLTARGKRALAAALEGKRDELGLDHEET